MIQQIIDRLKEEYGDTVDLLKEIRLALKSLRLVSALFLVRDLVGGIVMAVEEIATELGGVSGAEKKAAVKQFLNSVIDVPMVPEFIEGWVIDFAIDTAVAKYNELWGNKNWPAQGIDYGRKMIEFVRKAFDLPTPHLT